MSQIGSLVKEAIELSNRNVPSLAFTKACAAYNETVKKYFDKKNVTENEQREFFNENWWIINFVGLPKALPVTKDIIEESKKKIYKQGASFSIEDVLLFIILKNLTTKGLPMGFEFQKFTKFELVNEKILIPQQLIFGILSVVIFNPINEDEEIEESYWIGFGYLSMFVSELWGRKDLLERVMKYS